MKCICLTLPDALYYKDAPEAFLADLDQVATGEWGKLFRCRHCGQHWSIDDWDKYQERIIIRISEPQNWKALDSTELRRGLLLHARGGTTEEKCMWAGCEGRQVKGAVLCLEHLWATGARK